MDCSTCGGNGEWNCSQCRNATARADSDGPAASCSRCDGTGYVVCPTCGGTGYLEQGE